ncbi:MAG TPA: class I SAM-dependent methyltransferase [Blastocatellia bacterium]|nr:class I SAM-dependent methyltransferase [Blastocatellia bacterium]
MATSLIYRNSSLYELAMKALYGRHYASRYAAVAELIAEGSSVLDLCCGPALLFNRHLKHKCVTYTGLDVNERFIKKLLRAGASGEVWDLRSDRQLPRADYVIMQASLYHFLPDAAPIVDRMIEAARRQVIISEPVRNLATSRSRLLRFVGRAFTNPGSGNQPHRFTEASLDEFFSRYSSRVAQSFLAAGGRDKIYLLNK